MPSLVVALALASSLWQQQELPLDPGRSEEQGGIGIDWGGNGLAVLLDLRIGLLRDVTLRAPAAMELGFFDSDGARPGLAFFGGLTGIAYDPATGLWLSPVVGLKTFWRGHDVLAVMSAWGEGRLFLPFVIPFTFTANARAGLLHHPADALTLGAFLDVKWQTVPVVVPEPIFGLNASARLRVTRSWHGQLSLRGEPAVGGHPGRLVVILAVVFTPWLWRDDDAL